MIRTVLAMKGSARVLVLAAMVNSMGTGLFLAGAVLIYTSYLNIPLAVVGSGLAVAAVVGMVGSVPLARQADRFGAVRTLSALYLGLGVIYSTYLLIDTMLSFVVAVSAATVMIRAVPPINQAVAGAIVNGVDRSTTLATMRATRNAGSMVGSATAGLVIAVAGTNGYLIMLLGNSVSYLICGVLIFRLRKLEVPAPKATAPVTPALRNVRYLMLGLANGALGLHATMMIIALPLWVAMRSDVPKAFIPGIITVGALLVVILQVPLSRKIDAIAPARSAVTKATIALSVSCVLTALLAGANGPVLGTALLLTTITTLTLGEIYQTSSAWVVSHDLAPECRRSEYIATFSLGNSLQQIVGPPLFTVVIIEAGDIGWLLLAVGFAVAGTIYRYGLSRLAPTTQTVRSAESAHESEKA